MRLAPISDPAFVIPVPASQECVDLLKTKQVDAVTLDELVLQGFAERDPDLAVLPDVSFGEDERYGIGLPKGDIQLCEILTQGLRKLFTEGQWEVFFRNNFPNLDPERERFKPPAPYRFDRCT